MRKKVIYIVILLVVAILMFSASYALWNITLQQDTVNSMITDCFKIDFEEGDAVNLDNAYPMSDDELDKFYKTAKPFHFKVKNICTSVANVYINLESIETNKKRLADNYIDVVLYDGNATSYEMDLTETYFFPSVLADSNQESPVLENAIAAYSLYNFYLEGNTEREFNLLIYMNQDTPVIKEVMNAFFESKIVVKADYLPGDDGFSTMVDDVTKIVFQNTMEPIEGENVVFASDLGLNGLKNVMHYVVREDNGYTLYVQGDGKVYLPKNASYLFASMSRLESISGFEYVDTSNVTNMYAMFENCSRLTSLDLSSFDTSNVTNMARMFRQCDSLQTINLSGFDTSNVTNMANMFEKCYDLNDLSLVGLDTGNVEDMRFMFYSCNNLTSLDLSNFDTTSVIYMENMFYGCNKIKTLDLSNFNTEKLSHTDSMFENCTSLESVNLNSFNTVWLLSASRMFANCSKLTNLDLSTMDTRRIESFSGMFMGCLNLTSITYGENFVYGDYIGGVNIRDMYKNCPANKPTHSSWDYRFGMS